MFMIIRLTFFAAISFICFGDATSQVPKTIPIDGSYIFVSETITMSTSMSKPLVRKQPYWIGIYIFQKGSYSLSMESVSRNDDWAASFPKDYSELGYESEAGTYKIEGSHLTLKADVSLHPYRSSIDIEFQIEGNNLILRSKVPTHSKRIPSGDIVMILKRVPSKRLDDL